MKGYNRILNGSGVNFFGKDNNLDDETFHLWKNELQREIPNFWEDIVEKRQY